MPWIKCKVCPKLFYTKPYHQKKGWGIYCSNTCSFSARRRGKIVACEICKKEVYRTPKELKKSKNKKYYCTKSCFAVWKNQNLLIGEKHGMWIDGLPHTGQV